MAKNVCIINESERHYHVYNRPFFKPHPRYGVVHWPGLHEFTIHYGERQRSFRMNINEDGYRIARPTTVPVADGGEIWIFGCSWTLGWGVEDEETTPWLIQERFPGYNVRSFGVGMQGTTLGYMQMQDALRSARPAAAVFNYNPFHWQRNVASPRFLRAHMPVGRWTGDIMYPKAGLRMEGEIYTRLVRMLDPGTAAADELIVNIDIYYEILVTRRLFAAIADMMRAVDRPLIVVVQSGKGAMGDPVAQEAASRGAILCDAAIELTPETTLQPFDLHPNGAAHRHFADRLTPTLRQALEQGGFAGRADVP
jgi:hypothetical protein